jgi:hypothetical protein
VHVIDQNNLLITVTMKTRTFVALTFKINKSLRVITRCYRAIFLSNLPRAREFVSVNFSSLFAHFFVVWK